MLALTPITNLQKLSFGTHYKLLSPYRMGFITLLLLASASTQSYAATMVTTESNTVPSMTSDQSTNNTPTDSHPNNDLPETTLPALTVTATRTQIDAFNIPAAVQIIRGDALNKTGMQVDLSDALQGVPGLVALNRRNYAQDLQLSSRGSRLGVRGIRLYVDGIPATMPDGQGVTTHIDMNSIAKIEVLKGPFSSLYGNASSGTLLIDSERGSGAPTVETSVEAGRYDAVHYGVKLTGGGDDHYLPDYLISLNKFSTDGERKHSRADKKLANIKLNWTHDQDKQWALVFNHSNISAQDPGSLSKAQWRQNRRQVNALTTLFDTHKDVKQTQAGLSYEQPINNNGKIQLSGYVGNRDLYQVLPIPRATQINSAGHAGGIIDLDRSYAGLSGDWQQQVNAALKTVIGFTYDYMQDDRKGYNNFLDKKNGVQGALRRDEDDTTYSIDPYIQAQWQVNKDWTLDSGLRYSTVKFDSKDHYITATNKDDSGHKSYDKLLPTLGLSWHGLANTNLYAAYSKGFETGTFLELAYRPDGIGGLNLALRPLTSDNYEIGAKSQLAGGDFAIAAFRTDTKDDIVSAGTIDGRATYRNAGKTQRQGAEISWQGNLRPDLALTTAYTYVDANFADDNTPGLHKNDAIPGVAKHTAYTALTWQNTDGWRIGADANYSSKVYVNNANSEYAPAYTTVGAFAGYRLAHGPWQLDSNVRIDNLLDKDYIGSVVINDSNQRYYEPALRRNASIGLNLTYTF